MAKTLERLRCGECSDPIIGYDSFEQISSCLNGHTLYWDGESWQPPHPPAPTVKAPLTTGERQQRHRSLRVLD